MIEGKINRLTNWHLGKLISNKINQDNSDEENSSHENEEDNKDDNKSEDNIIYKHAFNIKILKRNRSK